MANERFPRRDAEFNDSMQNVAPYLTSNAVRLLVAPGTITQLGNLKTNWDSSYPLSQDPNLRTGSIIDHKQETRRSLQDLLRNIYKNIPDALLTTEDRRTLNLPKRDTVLTKRGKINDIPYVGIIAQPGAAISFKCRSQTDTARASMHPLADAVEVFYVVGGTVPVNPEACNKIFISTKARFDIVLDIAMVGQKFYCYSRWANLKDKGQSGNWTNLMTVTVGG